MKRVFLQFIVVFPLCLAPVLVLGAGKTPKAGGPDKTTSGDQAKQPAADQGPSDPRADNDAEQADSDKPDADTADSDKPEPPKTGSRPTSMIIIPERNGLKTLNIHFRWSIYPNASIEVRLVPGVIRKGATVSPVYFFKQLKGKVQEALFTCLDHPGDGGHTYSFTKDKLSYSMVGCRNSLGSQGAYVKVQAEDSGALQQSPRKAPSGARVQPVPRLAEDLDSPDPNPAAAFLQLDTWAVDQDTLALDLARDEFSQSGTLFVWFFRGDRVVWEEQIRWPGYK